MADNALKYWFNGVPLGSIANANDPGSLKYWFNGVPDPLIATSGSTSVTPATVLYDLINVG